MASDNNYPETSMAAIFQNQVLRYGDRICVGSKKDGSYVDISWNQMNSMIRSTAKYLLSLGIKKKEKVAIMSANRHEWWVADQAILMLGAVTVPLYPTSTMEEAAFILKNSDSSVCFTDLENLPKITQVRRKIPRLKKIICFDEPDESSAAIIGMAEARTRGAKLKKDALLETALLAVQPGDIATIVYTSGTTGDPKGVMLTHGNLLAQIDQIMDGYGSVMSDRDVLCSFLPLSHMIERMGGCWMPIKLGATVYFAESITTIVQDIGTVRPTILISVPRIYEKMHAGIVTKVKAASFMKRVLFNQAMKIAARNVPFACAGTSLTGFAGFAYALADRLIFRKLKIALGFDRLRFALSGGGPLNVPDINFFVGMGFLIAEGYGLTETAPVASGNRIGDITPGSVGKPLKGTEIKISPDGEVLIRGPQLFTGYYRNPRATREAFTKDGFFRSGDLGSLDAENRLSITGRIKDIIITSGGKNISPQVIEESIKHSPYIEQVALIGDRRPYIAALVVPSFDALRGWASRHGISCASSAELVSHERVQAKIRIEIDRCTRTFGKVSQVRAFRILDHEWSQQRGELTPTLKVKRRIIEERYAKVIGDLYDIGHDLRGASE